MGWCNGNAIIISLLLYNWRTAVNEASWDSWLELKNHPFIRPCVNWTRLGSSSIGCNPCCVRADDASLKAISQIVDHFLPEIVEISSKLRASMHKDKRCLWIIIPEAREPWNTNDVVNAVAWKICNYLEPNRALSNYVVRTVGGMPQVLHSVRSWKNPLPAWNLRFIRDQRSSSFSGFKRSQDYRVDLTTRRDGGYSSSWRVFQ